VERIKYRITTDAKNLEIRNRRTQYTYTRIIVAIRSPESVSLRARVIIIIISVASRARRPSFWGNVFVSFSLRRTRVFVRCVTTRRTHNDIARYPRLVDFTGYESADDAIRLLSRGQRLLENNKLMFRTLCNLKTSRAREKTCVPRDDGNELETNFSQTSGVRSIALFIVVRLSGDQTVKMRTIGMLQCEIARRIVSYEPIIRKRIVLG